MTAKKYERKFAFIYLKRLTTCNYFVCLRRLPIPLNKHARADKMRQSGGTIADDLSASH